MYYIWMGLTVLFGSSNCLPLSKTRILSWQAFILNGGYRAVANYKIPIIQYGGISSSKAPSSMEAREQLQIINKIPILKYRGFSLSKALSSVEATEQLQIIRSP
jgi:hypothetical protein